jgi:hypothetical protein
VLRHQLTSKGMKVPKQGASSICHYRLGRDESFGNQLRKRRLVVKGYPDDLESITYNFNELLEQH